MLSAAATSACPLRQSGEVREGRRRHVSIPNWETPSGDVSPRLGIRRRPGYIPCEYLRALETGFPSCRFAESRLPRF